MKSRQRTSLADGVPSASDLRRLRDAAVNGPTLFGREPGGTIDWILPGCERALLYRLIAECGLRAEEIIALPASNVHLETTLPYIVPGPLACASRQGAMLPVGGAVAAVLGELLQEKIEDQPLFRVTNTGQVERAIALDAKAADLGACKIDSASLLAAFSGAFARQSVGGVCAWSDGAVEVRP